jgi:endonuclease/exonuclease/phosphatase family metal-dependent hydrolase
MAALRVMTYNVRYFAHPTRGIASTASGIRAIADGLAALDPRPDLVCLQEVETRSLRSRVAAGATGDEPQLDRLMERLHAALQARGAKTRYDAYYFPAHTYRLGPLANIYTTGLAVLAKTGIKVLAHNAGKPHDITHRTRLVKLKQTRIAAHVAFEHRSGARVEIFNTHLSLPSFFKPEFWTGKARLGYGKNQLEEAKQLAKFIESQRQTDHYLVVGDFNSLPGSPVDEYLRGRGLTEARRVIAGAAAGAPGTEAFSTAGFMNLRMHIDHLYGSPAIEWVDMHDTHGFDGKGLFAGLSDHVPLIARFRLSAAG